jgi:hypothetical protein
MSHDWRLDYPYLPQLHTGYMDVFGDNHKNLEPMKTPTKGAREWNYSSRMVSPHGHIREKL